MDLKVKNDLSRTNCFTFSNISSLSGNQSVVDSQVKKLLRFIQSQKNPTVRSELETLLPPLICHLFIEMLKSKDWRPAHEFLRKYSQVIGPIQEIPPPRTNGTADSNSMMPPIQFQKSQPPRLNGSPVLQSLDEQTLNLFRDLITTLSMLRRIEDIKDRSIMNFLSCKYKAQLSAKTLSSLNNYLSKHGHVLIIQTLHLWFSLYEMQQESNDSDSSSSSECKNHIASHDAHQIDRGKDMKNILKTKSRLNDSTHHLLSQLIDQSGSDAMASNLKSKRLIDSLDKIDQKYQKPMRIFSINQERVKQKENIV